MSNAKRLNRRQFLFGSAMGVAGIALTACGGKETPTQAPEPTKAAAAAPAVVAPTKAAAPATAAPTKAVGPTAKPAAAAQAALKVTNKPIYVSTPVTPATEAPMLAEQVKAGKLPALKDRVPTNCLAFQPIHGIGEYGGTLRTLSGGLGNEWCQHQYGYSPIRFHKDSAELIPGMLESWETNADNTEWTFNWRKDLKWSDGQPCTVDDFLFWWNDMILNGQQGDQPPDWGSVSAKLAEWTKVDDYTLKAKFVAPAVFTAIRMAHWSKGVVAPRWLVPAHYMKQFHPKYNTEYKDFKTFNEKVWEHTNPDCPTLNPWRVEKYEPGSRRVWVRNPFYYVLDAKGNQLPYIDRLDETQVADAEVQKLKVTQGDIDFLAIHGMFLSDVSLLKSNEAKGNYTTVLWDSGSGTGMNYFWNYDHPDDKKRALYRDANFKRAMSHAIDRKTLQKIVYYDTGWPSTGTMTPKSIEFTFNDEAKKFYEWARDAYVEYNPDKAKQLLDDINVKDVNSDNWREMPDGSKLEVRIDLPANASKECMSVLEITRKNWEAIGLQIVINQVPAAEFNTLWNGAKGEIRTNWECTGSVEQLSWGDWLVPKEPTRWAPLCGNRKALEGTDKEDKELDKSPWDRQPPRWASTEAGYKDGPVKELNDIYDKGVIEVDPIKRYGITQQIIRLHVEKGPFLIGTVANYPRIIIVSKNLMNVPNRDETASGGMMNTWVTPQPAVHEPATFAFKKA